MAVPITVPAWVRFSSASAVMARAMPKSATFTCPVGGDEHVAGLHVAVDDAVAVGEAEGGGDVGADVGGPVGVQRALGAEDLGQAAAVDVLHDDEVGAVRLAPVVDADDVGVVEVGGRLASRRNRSTNAGSVANSGNSTFTATGPVEQLVAGEEHLGHAAAAELPVQLVAAVEDGGTRVGHAGLRLGGAGGAARAASCPAR